MAAAQAFIRDFHERWGAPPAAADAPGGGDGPGGPPRGPRWQECGWQEATGRAQAEGKFLMVYLHSSQHQVWH